MNPRPYAFVFAYDGPAQSETVLRWMIDVAKEDDYGLDSLRTTNPEDRGFFNHLFVDGIFILGKGFVLVDALPWDSPVARAIRSGVEVSPSEIWIHSSELELEILWIAISALNERLLWNNFDMNPYVGKLNYKLGE